MSLFVARRGTLAPVIVSGPPAPANVITDGSFASDDAHWSGSWYSGKTISGGKARFTASPAYDGFSQPITVTGGKYYELTWTISEWASGTVYAPITGGTQVNSAIRSANGTYTERLLLNAGNNVFNFMMETGGTLAVSGISLIGPYTTATVGGA